MLRPRPLCFDGRKDLAVLLFSFRLGSFSLAPQCFLSSDLSLLDPLFSLTSCFPLNLLHACPSACTDLTSVVGTRLGLFRGFDGVDLGFPRSLRCLLCTLDERLHRISANWRCVHNSRP